MAGWGYPTVRRRALGRAAAIAALLVLVLVVAVGASIALAKPDSRRGWRETAAAEKRRADQLERRLNRRDRQVRTLRAQRDDLQARLTRRVLEARHLRRALLNRPSSLEALHLAAVVYQVPFELLYRRASCESTGSQPAWPPSERTLNAHALNRSSSARGLLQFLDSTWRTTPFAGFDVYSPYANALAAGWMIGPAGRGSEWQCR